MRNTFTKHFRSAWNPHMTRARRFLTVCAGKTSFSARRVLQKRTIALAGISTHATIFSTFSSAGAALTVKIPLQIADNLRTRHLPTFVCIKQTVQPPTNKVFKPFATHVFSVFLFAKKEFLYNRLTFSACNDRIFAETISNGGIVWKSYLFITV